MQEHELGRISEPLRTHALCLREIGCNSWGFPWNIAPSVIQELAGQGMAILGGDVLMRSEGLIQYTYENWATRIFDGENWDSYVLRSRDESISYLSKLRSPNRVEILVDIVCSDQTKFAILNSP